MYKRSWNKKIGKSEIYTREDSYCQNDEIDMVKLADGQTKTYCDEGKDLQFTGQTQEVLTKLPI